jgi:heme-degrading monooxygenase HmoA
MEFEKIFQERKILIAAFDGCRGVELLRDIHSVNTYFTVSLWESEQQLEHYKNSALFQETWTTVKPWFVQPPQAWSVREIS